MSTLFLTKNMKSEIRKESRDYLFLNATNQKISAVDDEETC